MLECSYKTNEGNIWFGTTENGLYKYDGKSFNQFTVNDGLDCNKIYCILEDKDGKIWVGTEMGLGTLRWKGIFQNPDSSIKKSSSQ
jgi:ligand-binding sensor domain-containing protein